MGSMLSRVKFPTLVKILTSELSRISDTLASSILELLMRAWSSADGSPASGVVEGLVCSDSGSGLIVAVSAGLAFRYDASGISLVGDTALTDHPWRLISLREATTVTLDAADATHPRIDLICVADGEADARQTSVPIYDSSTKVFNNSNKYLDRRNSPSVIRMTGTPDPSPTAPATPAGYLALYTVRVPAGAADLSAATFVDVRTMIRGPGKLWADLVKKAGDTMSGTLVLPLLQVISTGALKTVLQMGSTADRGIRCNDSAPAAPSWVVCGSGGASGTGSKWGAGQFHATDGKYYGGAAGTTDARLELDTSGTYFWKILGAAAAYCQLRAANFQPQDRAPDTATSAIVRNLYYDLVPFAAAIVVDGSPPTGYGVWNLDFAAASRPSTGVYYIPYQVPIPATFNPVVQVSAQNNASQVVPTFDITTTEVRIYLWNAGVLVNCDFSVIVWAL